MSRIDEIRGRLAAYRTPGGCTLKEYEAMKDHAAEDIAYLLGRVDALHQAAAGVLWQAGYTGLSAYEDMADTFGFEWDKGRGQYVETATGRTAEDVYYEDIAYLLDEIERLRGELLEVRALLVGEHKMKSHLEATARPPCWYEYEGRNYLLRTPCPTCRKVLGGGE